LFLRVLSSFLHLLTWVALALSLLWLTLGIFGIVRHWPEDDGQSGRVVLVTHIIDAEDAKPNTPRCWVPYYDTSVMGIIHLEVDSVLAGEFPYDRLNCLDHLYQLKWHNMGNLFGLKLELEWSNDAGLYIVRKYSNATLPRTFLGVVLPALLALGMVIGSRSFMRWAHRESNHKNKI